MKKVAVLGYGVEGKAAYGYWTNQGDDVTVHDVDTHLKLPPGVKGVLGPNYLEGLDSYDLVARSPGVMPYLVKTSTPVTSVINEFMVRCPAKMIGVTGTKGKSTTASLIYHILKTAGRSVYLGGNIGEPPLDLLEKLKADDLVVLELSNVQLWDVTRSPQIAVLLEIALEHMDWHRGSMNEYVATKRRIAEFQTAQDLLVHHGNNKYVLQIVASTKARKLPFYVGSTGAVQQPAVWVRNNNIRVGEEVACALSVVTLVGKHNLENICAAIGATWELVKDRSMVEQAIRSFKPLEHRMEMVTQINGVTYINDSAATAPEAAIAAIAAIDGPKVLILGGSDKNVNFEELSQAVSGNNVKAAIVIGETAEQIAQALLREGFSKDKIILGLTKMADIVSRAADIAKAGDSVLLSPGCASFGLFANAKDRGRQFKEAAQALHQAA